MAKIKFAREGLPYFFILALLTVVCYQINLVLSMFFLTAFLFVLYFFRDPEREPLTTDERIILSPADGRVVEIEEIHEDKYLKCKAYKISIFLSIFNVHVNRSPIDGEIRYREYRAGKFIPAFKSHASEINEKNFVGIENDKIKVLVNQVTGFLARRIVCWVDLGDTIQQGERFGLIKFGSCTELIVPANVELNVAVGEKVIGGVTVLGRME